MKVKLGGILGITLLSSILLSKVYGFNIVIGHFHMLHKSSDLKECAVKILNENEYVGVRISQQGGTCQALPQSWGKDETMESGYDYAKKVFMQESFQFSRQMEYRSKDYWTIPGVLKPGAELEVFFSYHDQRHMISGFIIGLSDYLEETKPARGEELTMQFYNDNIGFQEVIGGDTTEEVKAYHWQSVSTYVYKLSLLAQTDSVRVLLNDVEFFTYSFEVVHLDTMKQVYSYISYGPSYAPVFIDRYQFKEKIN